jgi:arabinogalactan endo-1,4-beta-galactosidase
MKQTYLFGTVLLFFFGFCCQRNILPNKTLFLGGDLSYVNEMEDCGGLYQVNSIKTDPYKLFKDKGANIVRIRLWHTPDWTKYSTFEDVKRSIKRAKQNNMEVLLDFHYSDTWADPAHQTIPKAWENIKDTKILGDTVYAYTLKTLTLLANEGLSPEFVQVGNEINSEVMQYQKDASKTINWQRNVALLNRGIEAVNKVSENTGTKIQTMLHIAQPDEAYHWFENAKKFGIIKYDWIGLSYYPKWSKFTLLGLTNEVARLKNDFAKRVMIVETGYPYSIKNVDSASNILDSEGKLTGYDYTPDGQLKFMIDLTKAVVKGGGEGIVYWEPAWISTNCSTAWGKGSHWDNAIFFDSEHGNEALPVFNFFNQNLYK